MRASVAVLAGLLLAATLAPAVGADHLQAAAGRSLSFDHRGGNEWWVEVRLGGADAHAVSRVDAMDTGGAWKALTLRSWGNWAASFHVEPGHLVHYRATFPDGAQVQSCGFTHPDGAERCATTPPPPPPPANGTFDATFSGVKGNAWWVEAKVSADRPLTGVDARVDGGAWRALAMRSWGAWAASFHVPDGSLVELRARAASGETDLSGRYRWPAATPVDDGMPPPPPPGGFDATFSGVKGNKWWVEAKVAANKPLAGVDARVDGGEWRALSQRSWGAWAASFGIPEGSLVQLRARATDGGLDFSAGGYRWTTATPHPIATPGTFAADFRDVKGDAGRVEANVHASRDLAGVDARVDGGAWRGLARTSAGDWAAQMRVPDGARVQLRARDAAGAVAESGEYVWPHATPVMQPVTWPREGSHAVYYVDEGEHSPGGEYAGWVEVNLTLTYRDGRWEATCEGWSYLYLEFAQPQLTRERILAKAVVAPAHGPTNASVGDVVPVGVLRACGGSGAFFGELTVTGQGNHSTRKGGVAVTSPVRHAEWEPECSCMGSTASWHRGTGLTLDWWFAGRSSHTMGHLKDTDAPIARGDPPHREPSPAPGWPFEGSFVKYAAESHDGSGSYPSDTSTNVTLTYRDGRWTGTCFGTRILHESEYQDAAVEPIDVDVAFDPLAAPLRVQAGDVALVPMLAQCWRGGESPLLVKGRFPEDATRNGTALTTTAWWADERDEEDAEGMDHDAWWDARTGLVLRWETSGGVFEQVQGRLVDTDAPIG